MAIKTLFRDKLNKDADAIQEMVREISSFRKLDHPRLVKFLGICVDLPKMCFCTEFSENGSLYNLLHDRGVKLPQRRHALNMFMQITEGVEYMHSRNPMMVHRDLKSLNVVLDLQLNVKICDFGESILGDRYRNYV